MAKMAEKEGVRPVAKDVAGTLRLGGWSLVDAGKAMFTRDQRVSATKRGGPR